MRWKIPNYLRTLFSFHCVVVDKYFFFKFIPSLFAFFSFVFFCVLRIKVFTYLPSSSMSWLLRFVRIISIIPNELRNKHKCVDKRTTKRHTAASLEWLFSDFITVANKIIIILFFVFCRRHCIRDVSVFFLHVEQFLSSCAAHWRVLMLNCSEAFSCRPAYRCVDWGNMIRPFSCQCERVFTVHRGLRSVSVTP